MTILTELVECLGSMTQLGASEGLEKLLSRSRYAKSTVPYGSVHGTSITNCCEDSIDYIYEDYSSVDVSSNSRRDEVSMGNGNQPSVWRKLIRSLWTSFVITILVGMILLGTGTTVIVYLNLNTSNICSKSNDHVENIPKEVMALKFIADVIETMIINLWFPWTMLILFRANRFKEKHMKVLTISLTVGLATVLYKSVLFALRMYHRKSYYSVPSNLFFTAGIIYGSYVVAENIKNEDPTVSKLSSFVTLSVQFILGSIVCYALKYAIVPWFNAMKNEKVRAVAVAFAPSTALIPKVISLYFAGKGMTSQTNPGRLFILAWFPHGVAIIIFRVMQSDLKRLEIFTALCVFNGVVNIVMIATVRLRRTVGILLLGILKKAFCCSTNGSSERFRSHNLPLQQRLNADICIQTMLCGCTSLIITQAYFALYIITNFKVSLWPTLDKFIVRIFVSVAIDLFFNFICIFIQTNWHNAPIQKVWNNNWRVHIAVSFITVVMTMLYFSPILLTVIQTNEDQVTNRKATNCSLPFSHR